MTKSEFRKYIIISSLLTAIAIAIIIVFCVTMFHKYSQPSEKNTFMASGTVEEVYYSAGTKEVMIEMTDGNSFQLVCPWLSRDLYAAIGYDRVQLVNLLEGKNVEYRRMNELPWVVEIYMDDTVIDNNKLTSEEIITTRIGIVILGLMMLAIPICVESEYIKAKYKIYRKTEKKGTRKQKAHTKNARCN